jgi:hypothetical protein
VCVRVNANARKQSKNKALPCVSAPATASARPTRQSLSLVCRTHAAWVRSVCVSRVCVSRTITEGSKKQGRNNKEAGRNKEEARKQSKNLHYLCSGSPYVSQRFVDETSDASACQSSSTSRLWLWLWLGLGLVWL